MSACLALFGLLVGCSARPPGPPPQVQDAWVAEDKLQHFTVSAAATTLGYGVARSALEHGEARLAAAAVASGLGIGKEVVDARRGGPFSLKDLVWDAAGVALGIALIQQVR